MKVSGWIGRSFSFDFPAGLYPNVLARLRGTPARAAALVHPFEAAALTRRPASGKWSAQENIGHLSDLDGLWLRRVDDFLAGAAVLSAWDVTNQATTDANYNAREIEDVLAGLATIRTELLRRCEDLTPPDFERVALHPRLKKPMRLVDALWFSAEHDDHHLAIAWELLYRP